MFLGFARSIRGFIAWLAGLGGVLYVPADVFGFLKAHPQLAVLTSTVDRFAILALFSTLLVFYLFWIDVRPYIKSYFTSAPSEETLRAVGNDCLALASDIAMELMSRTRSAPRGDLEPGLGDRAQRRLMDESSAYGWESVQIYSDRFSSKVAGLFQKLRRVGVEVPPLESSPLLPHWMEDIARFLACAGPAVAAGDIDRANQLVFTLKREIQDQRGLFQT